jgi:small-conductance mechanosensitive channel
LNQLQIKKQNIFVYCVVALLIGLSIIYLQMGLRNALRMSSHSSQPSFRHPEQIHGNSQNSGQIRIPGGQMAFFITVGLADIPVAIWILKNKRSSNKVPYIIAIAGSAGLIILYVLSRTVNLPLVGFEEHVGSVDVLSKILQVGIIICSTLLLLTQHKQQMTKLRAPSIRIYM